MRLISAKNRIRQKCFRLDAGKISRVRKVLRAATDAEAIDRALDLVLDEHKQNRRATVSHHRFVQSRIAIRDVYGNAD